MSKHSKRPYTDARRVYWDIRRGHTQRILVQRARGRIETLDILQIHGLRSICLVDGSITMNIKVTTLVNLELRSRVDYIGRVAAFMSMKNFFPNLSNGLQEIIDAHV